MPQINNSPGFYICNVNIYLSVCKDLKILTDVSFSLLLFAP